MQQDSFDKHRGSLTIAFFFLYLCGRLHIAISYFLYFRDYIGPKVPYVAMRMLCGLMGAAVVPMAFYTIRNSGHSLHASILAAVLVLFGMTMVI